MHDLMAILALASPQKEGDPLLGMVPILLMFGVFYFILILPMRKKQKNLEKMQKSLQPGQPVVLNPGILGTVVGAEGEVLVVRIAEQTKIKVLRSAVAALQDQAAETEKK